MEPARSAKFAESVASAPYIPRKRCLQSASCLEVGGLSRHQYEGGRGSRSLPNLVICNSETCREVVKAVKVSSSRIQPQYVNPWPCPEAKACNNDKGGIPLRPFFSLSGVSPISCPPQSGLASYAGTELLQEAHNTFIVDR